MANIASAFGAKVIYYSTSEVSRSDDYERVTLKKLLSDSDIISIHAPFNDKTEGLINTETLSQMSKQPVLLNLGRGGIVVEKDMIEALNSGKLKGACLDVFEQEPFSFKTKYDQLMDDKKVLFSPHVAWASEEAREELLNITYNNLDSWINKQK